MGRLGATKRALLSSLFILYSAITSIIPLASCRNLNSKQGSVKRHFLKVLYMTHKLVTFIVLCFILSSCSTVSFYDREDKRQSIHQANLVSYEINERYVHIEVLSNGCTFINSFELKLVDRATNSLEIIRRKPDFCKMKPIKISLDYAFRHLGIDRSRPVRIVNSVMDYDVASGN